MALHLTIEMKLPVVKIMYRCEPFCIALMIFMQCSPIFFNTVSYKFSAIVPAGLLLTQHCLLKNFDFLSSSVDCCCSMFDSLRKVCFLNDKYIGMHNLGYCRYWLYIFWFCSGGVQASSAAQSASRSFMHI